MHRFRNYRLMCLYSNTFQSLVLKPKRNANVVSFALNSSACYSSQTDSIDVNKSVHFNKNLADLRQQRLHIMRRNTSSGDYDIVSEAIIQSESMEQMLELISSHVEIMNNRHLAEVFESLHDIIKTSDDYSAECRKLLSSKQFKQLCNQTIKQMPFFQTSAILTTLKTLVLINVRPNTPIVENLLQTTTRQLINDFSVNEIIFLDFLLSRKWTERTEKCLEETSVEVNNLEEYKPQQRETIVPLIEALKLSLPLVLQLKIESKELDFDDIDLVVKCLQIAAKHNLKDEVINKLTAAVYRKMTELTVTQTYSVLSFLISTNINTNLVDRVVNQCLDRVTAPGVPLPNNISQKFIASLITHKTGREFYHNGLYEMVANLILQNPNKYHISQLINVLWALTKQSHVHYELLDLVSYKIIVGDSDLLDNEKIYFNKILNAFALPSNYRPNEPNSEVVYKNILNSNHIKLCKQRTKHLLFYILRHLFVLNYYPKEEITDWIRNYLIDALFHSTRFGLRMEFLQNILILYQGLCLESDITDCEDLKQKLKPFVEELNAFQCKQLNGLSKSQSLQLALAQGLGGKQFVTNNVFTDFGHLVDHVVVMRTGGHPVPIEARDEVLTHIKQLEVPTDSKIIGIIATNYRDYCRETNTCIKKGETDFRLRTLKKCGITPITINLEGWEALAKTEKISYVMRELQENSNIDEKQTTIP